MAKKVAIPWELKYKYVKGAWLSFLKGVLYVIREESGPAAALKMYEKVSKREDRVKKMTTTIKDVFKIGGNDCEAIAMWHDIWWELTGTEGTWLERSKTISRCKVATCPFKLDAKDIGDFSLIFENIVVKAINPKATVERPKGMCAGDPYCDYIWRIEDST